MRLGLTGGIASGKNLAATIFENLGCYIIDADEVYHKLIYQGKPLWKRLVSHFGSTIVHPEGMIDRKKLRSIVFNNPHALDELNRITHGEIVKELEREARKKEELYRIIVINAPLLIEAGALNIIDKVIVVWVKRKIQIERLIDRDNIDHKEAIKRINAQMPLGEKLEFADYIIDNNHKPEYTKLQIELIYKELLKKLV